MNDILLSNSNADTLERLFEEVKKALLNGDYKLLPKNTKRRFYQLGETDSKLLMTFKNC